MARPTPKVTGINRPFWEGCNEGRFVLQRCEAEPCRRFVYFPRVCCPHCGGGDLAWEEASGRGRVTTFTVVHHPLNEALAREAPFVFAAVTLDEGPLLYTRLDVQPDETEGLCGRPVEVVFKDDALPGQTLPFFRPGRAQYAVRDAP